MFRFQNINQAQKAFGVQFPVFFELRVGFITNFAFFVPMEI